MQTPKIKMAQDSNGLNNKRYAIIQETVNAHTKEVIGTETLHEVNIHGTEDFIEVSHNIAYENARAKEISKNLGFLTYTVKKLISL